MTQITAQAHCTLDASADQVWRALTDPKTFGKVFMGAKVETDFKVGSSIRFKGEFKGKPYEDKGEILEAQARRRLSFSHYSPMSGQPDTPANYHVVTFELVAVGQGTQVTLRQSNLEGGVKVSDKEHRGDYEKTWAGVLKGLSKAVAH